jgi:hypothetical protein
MTMTTPEAPTCEFVVGPDFHTLTACGQPASARATDGATDEEHYVCAEHEAEVEGFYVLEPLGSEDH